MAALGKYRVIEADSIDACRRQRAMLEQALREADLTQDARAELQLRLQRIDLRQKALEEDQEVSAEQKKKKEGKSGDGDQQGGQGSAGSGSSGGSGGGMLQSDSDAQPQDDDFSTLEAFELLFILAEQNLLQSNTDAVPAGGATLLFDRRDQVVQIKDPYAPTDMPHTLVELLPTIEKHAVNIGAQTLHVDVHAEAVDMFKKKFGYEPLGNLVSKKGSSLQKMRKKLTHPASLHGSAPDVA